MIRRKLERKEEIDLTPIDIVYETSYDESIPVPCFSADQVFRPIKVILVEWLEEGNVFQVELSDNAIFVKIFLPRMRKP